MYRERHAIADLGVGIGLRVPHYREIFETRPAVDFFEIISENFMVRGGKPRRNLGRIRDSYRLVQHGVSLGIAGPEPPDREYLAALKVLVREVEPPWVSDHLCWSGAGGAHLHDLLPLPFTAETVHVVAERARQVQDFLEVPFLLENTSSYLEFSANTCSEWEFVSEIVEAADVGLLFDVNNVFVSAHNHGFDPLAYVRGIPHHRVAQIHLAGHTNRGNVIIDTHRGPIIPPVWDLYRETLRLTGPVSTLIEWDEAIPPLGVVLAEAETARRICDAVRSGGASAAPMAPVSLDGPAESPAAHRAWSQGGPREHAG